MKSAFNMPDGCMYPSDLDQYDALNGRFEREESDEDPTPDDVDRIITECDHFNSKDCAECEALAHQEEMRLLWLSRSELMKEAM